MVPGTYERSGQTATGYVLSDERILMKFSAQEEYGLRCLIQIAKRDPEGGMSIPEVSEAEGLSTAHVAKLLRILRIGGFIESTRGYDGGYRLAAPPETIRIGDVLRVLGGRLFEEGFCERHAVTDDGLCTHTVDCSVRSVWQTVQKAVDSVLEKITLKDLITASAESLTPIELPVSLNRVNP